VEPDLRDAVVDFIRHWAEKTGLAIERLLEWLGLSVGKFYEWRQRYGRTNQHNGSVPRDFWLQTWEKQAILDFQQLYPLEGYRRLTYMMIDARTRRGGCSSARRGVVFPPRAGSGDRGRLHADHPGTRGFRRR